MNAVASKMFSIKGVGIGKSAVMGKLSIVRIKQDTVSHNDESEWDSFSRLLGIVISRIEEAYEYLVDMGAEDIRMLLCNMLGLIRKREFLSEIKNMTDKGYGALSAIQMLKMNDGSVAFDEVCRVFYNADTCCIKLCL